MRPEVLPWDVWRLIILFLNREEKFTFASSSKTFHALVWEMRHHERKTIIVLSQGHGFYPIMRLIELGLSRFVNALELRPPLPILERSDILKMVGLMPNLIECRLKDAALFHLQSLAEIQPSIRSLWILSKHQYELKDIRCFHQLHQLQELSSSYWPFEELTPITQLSQLQSLLLCVSSTNSLSSISSMHQLTSLALLLPSSSSTDSTYNITEQLRTLTALRLLKLNTQSISTSDYSTLPPLAGSEFLSELKSLQSFQCSSFQLPARPFTSALSSLIALTCLSCVVCASSASSSLDDDDSNNDNINVSFDSLRRSTQLRKLELILLLAEGNDNPIVNTIPSTLVNLQEVRLSFSNYNDANFSSFSNFNQLRSLRLAGISSSFSVSSVLNILPKLSNLRDLGIAFQEKNLPTEFLKSLPIDSIPNLSRLTLLHSNSNQSLQFSNREAILIDIIAANTHQKNRHHRAGEAISSVARKKSRREKNEMK